MAINIFLNTMSEQYVDKINGIIDHFVKCYSGLEPTFITIHLELLPIVYFHLFCHTLLCCECRYSQGC